VLSLRDRDQLTLSRLLIAAMSYTPSLWVCLVLLLGVVITYLGLSERQRDIVRQRILRGRRISSADTPPRSLSPEKASKVSQPKPNEYAGVFPPSQREWLNDLAPTLSSAQRAQLGNLRFDQRTFEASVLGWTEDFRLSAGTKYSPSGFSIQEIRALGDFPNFGHLTGVADPDPYCDFDITRAVPRPYRPFRWPYHQTMCTSLTLRTRGDTDRC
jgi:hypothetical protein